MTSYDITQVNLFQLIMYRSQKMRDDFGNNINWQNIIVSPKKFNMNKKVSLWFKLMHFSYN